MRNLTVFERINVVAFVFLRALCDPMLHWSLSAQSMHNVHEECVDDEGSL